MENSIIIIICYNKTEEIHVSKKRGHNVQIISIYQHLLTYQAWAETLVNTQTPFSQTQGHAATYHQLIVVQPVIPQKSINTLE